MQCNLSLQIRRITLASYPTCLPCTLATPPTTASGTLFRVLAELIDRPMKTRMKPGPGPPPYGWTAVPLVADGQDGGEPVTDETLVVLSAKNQTTRPCSGKSRMNADRNFLLPCVLAAAR
jgi:hypothetical protein